MLRPPSKPRTRVAATCVLLLWWCATAMASAAPLANMVRDVWTSRDGLPHNSVNAIAQTADGYLWIATWEGLIRYNGVEFESFDRDRVEGFPDNGVRALLAASDGSLWVGTARGGLARRIGHRWEFPPPARSLVTAMLEDRRGRIWIATENDGVERIDADGSRHFFDQTRGLPSNACYSLAEDGQGALWVGTAEGLVQIVGERVQPVTADRGLPAGGVPAVRALLDGSLLLGTEHGAYLYRGDRGERIEGIPGEAIFSLLVDADGTRWYGGVRSGLYRQQGERVERIGSEHGLPNQRIAVLFGDREGNVWLGSNGGLVRLHDAPFATLTRFHGLSDNFVRAVLPFGTEQIWIGSSRGLSRIERGRVLPAPDPDPLANESILSLAAGTAGEAWIGTYGSGLLRWRDGGLVERWSRGQGLPSNEVRSILWQRDGGVWAGTSLGLSHVLDGQVTTYGLEHGLPGYFISALVEASDGRIWVGTAGGAAVIEGGRIQPLDLSSMDGAEFVFGFHEDRGAGRMWIVTDRGLIRHELASGQQVLVGRRQGLPVEKNFHLLVDRLGAFWLSSNRGVSRLAPGSADAVADAVLAGREARLQARLFGVADGMVSAQGNGGSGPPAAIAQDGSVWIGTAMGVSHIRPDLLGDLSSAPPPVVVEAIRADGLELDLSQGDPVRLPVGTQRLELGYAGLSYLTRGGVRYRTRLEGFDPDWVERRGARSAEYTNLPPGNYVFRVAAANPDSGWSEQEAVLRLRLPAHFWQLPLFWWALAVLLFGLLLLMVRVRLLRSRQRELELQVLVDRQTRDLRQRANELAELAREREQLAERLRDQAAAFERQAREDGLTGLVNRRGFDEHLQRVLAQALRSGSATCLAMLDIDHFKRVNDEHSHAAGDQVLQAVANTLRTAVRAGSVVARWGGEEFVVLFPDTSLAQAQIATERIRAAIEHMDANAIVPGLRQLTVSAGVGEIRPGEAVERFTQRVDAALYRAKAEGRNRLALAEAAAPGA